MRADSTPPRGTRDLLAAQAARRDQVALAIAAVYERFGYRRIETPALESLDRLLAGQGGENEKLVFRVLKRGLPGLIEAGTEVSSLVDLGLRFDLTVPLARFWANNAPRLADPFRSFQLGPVWRAERPQRGRWRQFHQCDIDIIGEATVLAEAELIEATIEALAAVGLTGVTLRLSDRRLASALAAGAGLPEERWPHFYVALDKLDRLGFDGVRAELCGAGGLPPAAVDPALATLAGMLEVPTLDPATLAGLLPALTEEAVAGMDTTIGLLAPLAARGGWSLRLDPTLVRGMGYYTGQIFEVAHPASGSSIAGGGRYDDLVGRPLDRRVPACGFSIGFERILELVGPVAEPRTVALLYEPEARTAEVLEAARRLRAAGNRVSAVARSGKLGSQLTRLEANGFGAWAQLRGPGDGAGPTGVLPEPKPLSARPT